MKIKFSPMRAAGAIIGAGLGYLVTLATHPSSDTAFFFYVAVPMIAGAIIGSRLERRN